MRCSSAGSDGMAGRPNAVRAGTCGRIRWCYTYESRPPRLLQTMWSRSWPRTPRSAASRYCGQPLFDPPVISFLPTSLEKPRTTSSTGFGVSVSTMKAASTDNGVDPHDLCRSHDPGHARAADTAGSSGGAVLQECCLYPEQAGVRVRPLVPAGRAQPGSDPRTTGPPRPRVTRKPTRHRQPSPLEQGRYLRLREVDPGPHDAAAGQLPPASAEHKPSSTPARLPGRTPERR
jgi:hypothetical protein